ncbi:MAG: hypothetical protein AAFN81_33515, partial [Bacteroidota bacterium]
MARTQPKILQKLLWSMLLLIGSFSAVWAQLETILISEINADNQVELINTGTETLDVGGLWLCDFPRYDRINDLTVVCGDSENLAPGEVLVVSGWTIDPADGELGIYTNSSFGSSSGLTDYVEWGSTGHTRSGLAVSINIWNTGDVVPAFGADESISWDGANDSPASWAAGASSLCEVNSGGCEVSGGTLTGGPFEFTVGDGEADMIPAGSITVANSQGENFQWIVTDDEGNILGLPPMPSVVNFDGAGAGTC